MTDDVFYSSIVTASYYFNGVILFLFMATKAIIRPSDGQYRRKWRIIIWHYLLFGQLTAGLDIIGITIEGDQQWLMTMAEDGENWLKNMSGQYSVLLTADYWYSIINCGD